jgi:hypothetical protein
MRLRIRLTAVCSEGPLSRQVSEGLCCKTIFEAPDAQY